MQELKKQFNAGYSAALKKFGADPAFPLKNPPATLSQRNLQTPKTFSTAKPIQTTTPQNASSPVLNNNVPSNFVTQGAQRIVENIPSLEALRMNSLSHQGKLGNFNPNMYGAKATDGKPATSANYNSATVADSSLARAPQGRPAIEQANTSFRFLDHQLPDYQVADEWGNASGALNKVAIYEMMGSLFNKQLPAHPTMSRPSENRGPTVNPYQEYTPATRKSPPLGGMGGYPMSRKDILDKMFKDMDNQVDAGGVETSIPEAEIAQ